MPRRNRTRLTVAVVLCAAFTVPALANKPRDIATCMPADTLIYFGWSPQYAVDDHEIALQKKYLDAAFRLAAQQGDDSQLNTDDLRAATEALVLMMTGAGCVALFDVTVAKGPPEVQAALVYYDAVGAPKLAKTVHETVHRLLDEGEIENTTLGDTAFEAIPLGDLPMRLLWGLHDDHLIVAVGQTAATRVLATIAGDEASLAEHEEFVFDRKKVGAQLEPTYLCMYANVERLVARGQDVASTLMGSLPPMVDPLLSELGINSVKSKYLHADMIDGKPRTQIFAHVEGPRVGLLKLYEQRPLKDADLRIVPKNAYWAQVGNLDLAAFWEEVVRVMGAVDPDIQMTVQGSLAMGAQMLGFSITDQVLPALGDTWAAFDAPDHGGILGSGTVITVEVRDQDVIRNVLHRVVQMTAPLAASEDVALAVHELKHKDLQIEYVLVGGLPVPVAPAWSFVDGRMMLALSPQTLAVAIDHATSDDAKSILDRPCVQATRSVLPEQAQSFGFCDMQYLMRLIYPIGNLFSTAGASQLAPFGTEIDFRAMPTLPQMLADVHNAVSECSVDDDGIHYVTVGSGAPLSVVVGGAALATSIMLPALTEARFEAKSAVSASNLRLIGTACMIYANDHDDQLPPSLDTLVAEGAIPQRVLESPLAPAGTRAYTYIARDNRLSAETNPSRSVLAYEWYGAGTEALVLFVDCHVERMEPNAFKEVLRETYTRLGRPEDFPEHIFY